MPQASHSFITVFDRHRLAAASVVCMAVKIDQAREEHTSPPRRSRDRPSPDGCAVPSATATGSIPTICVITSFSMTISYGPAAGFPLPSTTIALRTTIRFNRLPDAETEFTCAMVVQQIESKINADDTTRINLCPIVYRQINTKVDGLATCLFLMQSLRLCGKPPLTQRREGCTEAFLPFRPSYDKITVYFNRIFNIGRINNGWTK